jgi:hypothetical protein
MPGDVNLVEGLQGSVYNQAATLTASLKPHGLGTNQAAAPHLTAQRSICTELPSRDSEALTAAARATMQCPPAL